MRQCVGVGMGEELEGKPKTWGSLATTEDKGLEAELVRGARDCSPWPCWLDELFLSFELWCVPPTTAPTTAQMMTTMMATMKMMLRRVRYHGTLATTGSWPFDADSSL